MFQGWPEGGVYIGVMGTIRMEVSDRAETMTPRDADLYTYLSG